MRNKWEKSVLKTGMRRESPMRGGVLSGEAVVGERWGLG